MRKFYTVINFTNPDSAKLEMEALRTQFESGIKALEKFQTGCETPQEAFAAANTLTDVVKDIAAAFLCKQITLTTASFGINDVRKEGEHSSENLKCRKCNEKLPPQIGEVTCPKCQAKYVIDAVKTLGSSDDLNIVADIT